MRRLFVDFAGMGDLVMLVPMMRALAADGELDLLTREMRRALFDEQTFLARTFGMTKPNRGDSPLVNILLGGERRRTGRRLAARGYDEIVVFRQERRPVTAWIDRWRGNAAVRVCDLSPGPGRVHMGDANAHALETGGFSTAGLETAPRLDVVPGRLLRARADLGSLGARVVLLHPGSDRTRRWIRSRSNLKGLTGSQWARFATWLLSSKSCDAIVISGSAPEGAEARAIRRLVPEALRGRVHDRTGRIALADLPAYFAAAAALVSVDTGPAHVAAAVGCPLVEVFGPTDPAIYLPRARGPISTVLGSAPCQFCHGTPVWKSCRDNVCLKSLPEDALRAGWDAVQTGRILARG